MCLTPYIKVNDFVATQRGNISFAFIDGEKIYKEQLWQKYLVFSPNVSYEPCQLNTICNIYKHLKFKRVKNSYYCKSSKEDVNAFLSNNYVVLDNGKTLPLFQAIPCGSYCKECYLHRTTELRNRMLLEADDASNIFFFTLTYDNSHLVLDEDGVPVLCPHHMQLFFKRLRIVLDRFYNIPKFRTFYVGEYGGKRQRPHYHGLLYFYEPLSKVQILNLLSVFYHNEYHRNRAVGYSNVWEHGYIRDIQAVRNKKACSCYVSKYLLKQFDYRYFSQCSKSVPPFYRSPRRNGGLGAYRLKERFSDLERCYQHHSKYTLHDGRTSFHLPVYICQKIKGILSREFPCFRLYTAKLKLLLDELLLRNILEPFYSNMYHNLYDMLLSYHDVVEYISNNYPLTRALDIHEVRQLQNICRSYSVHKLFTLISEYVKHIPTFKDISEQQQKNLKYSYKFFSEFIKSLNLDVVQDMSFVYDDMINRIKVFDYDTQLLA